MSGEQWRIIPGSECGGHLVGVEHKPTTGVYTGLRAFFLHLHNLRTEELANLSYNVFSQNKKFRRTFGGHAPQAPLDVPLRMRVNTASALTGPLDPLGPMRLC